LAIEKLIEDSSKADWNTALLYSSSSGLIRLLIPILASRFSGKTKASWPIVPAGR